MSEVHPKPNRPDPLATHSAIGVLPVGEQHTPGPTVDDLQRELLAICRGGSYYETWARVSGLPMNERCDWAGRTQRQQRVREIRRQIHALNPNAALYFGWGPSDEPTERLVFFAETANARAAGSAS